MPQPIDEYEFQRQFYLDNKRECDELSGGYNFQDYWRWYCRETSEGNGGLPTVLKFIGVIFIITFLAHAFIGNVKLPGQQQFEREVERRFEQK